MQTKKMVNKKEKIKAIFQIANLILSVMAIAFFIGVFNIEFVSSEFNQPGNTNILAGKGAGGLSIAIQKSELIKEIGAEIDELQKIIGPLSQEQTKKLTELQTKLTDAKALEVEGSSGLSQVFGVTAGTGFDAILTGAQWAFITWGIIQTVGGMLGVDEEQKKALSTSVALGMLTYKGLSTALGKGGVWESGFGESFLGKSGWSANQVSFAAAAIVIVAIYALTYKEEEKKLVTFTCNPWDAPVGGNNCEKCNEQGVLPCSEYQCRSLGQACQLLNPGTDKELCTWVNKNDVNPPIMQPMEGALLDGYAYTPDKAVNPPDRGVIIINKESAEGCAKAFTPLSFGVTLDEPAKCKIDYLRNDNFDEMEHYFGGSSLSQYNHTQVMSMPGPSAFASENLTMPNDGQFTLYARCQDANGNYNKAVFAFKFCVEKGPDTTPPIIVATSILNGMPIAFNQSSLNLSIYVNEPATCKWSHLDQSYEKMEETVRCSSRISEINAQMLYPCTTTLTGLKNEFENNFYFRCMDKPLETEDNNVNSQSYKFTLLGTKPIVISSASPNGTTVRDATDMVRVALEAKTSAGYKEGESLCYYSETGEENDYVMFFNTNSYKHLQELWLPEGDYKYFIKCIDLGGNFDTAEINFKVESDNKAPLIIRAYHEEEYLKLITSEKAECVYSTADCNYLFEDGTKIAVIDDTSHFTDWNTKTSLYIKCQDEFKNKPLPNQCSMIVRPFIG